nr:MAG TPA: hypothetical protein [Caudoviricetes sp.]
MSIQNFTFPIRINSSLSHSFQRHFNSYPFHAPLFQFKAVHDLSQQLHWISFIRNIFPCKTSFAAIVPLSDAV